MFLPQKVFRTRYLARLTQKNYIVHLSNLKMFSAMPHSYVCCITQLRQAVS